jgi:hydrogenase maturation protease
MTRLNPELNMNPLESKPANELLLIAIGNDARQDDGLGWAFGQAMEASNDFQGEVVYRYQLQVEDALLITGYRTVLFVDACREELPMGFAFTPLQADADFGFTTHQLSPATVLALSKQLYGAAPQAFLLKISGTAWALERGFSKAGAHNLASALNEAEAFQVAKE